MEEQDVTDRIENKIFSFLRNKVKDVKYAVNINKNLEDKLKYFWFYRDSKNKDKNMITTSVLRNKFHISKSDFLKLKNKKTLFVLSHSYGGIDQLALGSLYHNKKDQELHIVAAPTLWAKIFYPIEHENFPNLPILFDKGRVKASINIIRG